MSGFGKHYIMVGAQATVFAKWGLSAFALANISDRSLMLLPSVEYQVHDNISAELMLQAGIGDQGQSEYGAVYPGVLLKVTGYF
jgi:hypothetical protein